MVCTKCGLGIDTGAVFCGNCGQPVQNTTGATPVPAAQASTEAVAGAVPAPIVAAAVQPGAALPGYPEQVAAQVSPAVPVSAPVAAPATAEAFAPGVPAYGLPEQAAGPGGGKAIAAMVLGILGVIASLIPILGAIFGGLAVMFSKQSKQSSHASMSKAGFILGSIALTLSGIVFSYNLSTVDKTATALSALLR